MPEFLSALASRLAEDPSRRQELEVAVLLWQAPTLFVAGGQTLELTRSSIGPQAISSEPLIFPLRKGSSRSNAFVMGVTVGRTSNNDLVLGDPSVSRFHAYFIKDSRRKEIWNLVDADSRNGTWVDGTRLQPNVGNEIHDQALLRFGEVEMIYLTPESLLRHIGQPGGQLP